MASSSTISGLREQIIDEANAASAFPAEVQLHLLRNNTSIIKPCEIFDVVVIPDQTRKKTPQSFRAVLVELHPNPKDRLSSTKAVSVGESIEAALMGLLSALGEIAMHNLQGMSGTVRAIQEDGNARVTLRNVSREQYSLLEKIEQGRV
ncbi:hypothetical protein PRZ48_013967 [Zasmidium cellare]|uniref:Uncharacterized protein n=1 Tax=Zasmidium cellare TaxID=395010 RepID=A0ABR0DZL2_ZASCE|nr:hypothetical protein PRZ48_013967 [Zasmidium cellare]